MQIITPHQILALRGNKIRSGRDALRVAKVATIEEEMARTDKLYRYDLLLQKIDLAMEQFKMNN